MEYIKTFLETSTIHGLTYISESKNNTRIFWIFVVVAGFSVAGIMIYESAKTWAENPVRTTIETLPIGRIKKYPTVTVCPPQNTYTNLNYDLMMLENMTLDNNIREELLNNSKVLYNDHLYDQVMKSLNKLQDNDRYYNWYYGFTKIEIPSETYELEAYWGYSYYQSYLHYFMTTYALSGMVATKGFQEKLNVDMVDTNIDYQLEFRVPSNATLAVDIEKVAVEGTGTDVLSFNNEKIIYDKLSKNITLTERKQKVTLTLKRSVSSTEVRRMKMMPGFKILWSYTGIDRGEAYFLNNSQEGITKGFIRNNLNIHSQFSFYILDDMTYM